MKIFSYISGKWNFPAPRLKTFLHFLKNAFPIFWETELSSPRINIFPEMEISNFLTFLYFFKRSFSYILRRTSKLPKTKISYISPKKVINKFF